ncbi:MAG: CvpA family protein [Thermoanaerobaculaceae bacterium]
MDVLVISVVLGLAILGAFWGFLRILSLILAISGAAFLGRWAGPPLAEVVFSPAATSFQKLLTSAAVGAVAAGLFLLAGMGIRRFLQSVHLGFLDRLLGAVATMSLALLLASALLGLAATGGFPVHGKLSSQLAQFGRGVLAVYKLSKSSQSPNNSPSSPTNNGQQPKEP